MGCNESRFNRDDLINTTIQSIKIVNPQIETIDYEGYYSTEGQLKLHLVNNQRESFIVTGYFNDKYSSNDKDTNVIRTMENTNTPLNMLNGKRIVDLEKIITKKILCLTNYYYLLTLENAEQYKIFVNRFS